ncbi:MAG: DUF3025 domain-containing protein [Burkholderiales bacterium]
MDWAQAQSRLRDPLYAPLAPSLARLGGGEWPALEALNALAAGIANASGTQIRFVPAREPGGKGLPHYESRVAVSGEVETRDRNWHDLFNALAWIAFPKAKAAINAQHAAMLAEGGAAEARHRSPPRDALSLFDEGGIAIASSSPALLGLVLDFEWKELFWRRRGELAAKARFVAFGHGLFEQALEPFVGLVAKSVFVPVDDFFAMLPPEAQVARVDELLAAHFAHRPRFPSPRAMAPVPVLGIPGWHPGGEHESFYDDARHFRPKPGGRAESP